MEGPLNINCLGLMLLLISLTYMENNGKQTKKETD